MESGSHIAIAKSVDRILASVDRCHHLAIGVPHRVECSMPPLLATYCETHLGRFCHNGLSISTANSADKCR